MKYKASDIAGMLGTPSPGFPDRAVSVLLSDSRSLESADEALFFAVKTRFNDGHNYVADLYGKGVRNFVVQRVPDFSAEECPDANFFVVADPVAAMQTIAAAHRRRFGIPVVGITGSRGKTAVKEWLFCLLQSDYNITRSPRSYNSQIGVPLSVWGLDDSTGLGIFEAGISQAGEMARIAPVVAPTIGVLTNIGDEHSEGFISDADKCREKMLLFSGADSLVYCVDNPVVAQCAETLPSSVKRMSWSATGHPGAALAVRFTRKDDMTEVAYSTGGQEGRFTVPFTAATDLENVASALAVMLILGVDKGAIASRMAALKPVGTRLTVIEGVNNCMIVSDSSSTTDLLSLSTALDFTSRRLTPGSTLTVILGDLLDEGIGSEELYRRVGVMLAGKGVGRLIGIGHDIIANKSQLDTTPKSVFFPSPEAMLSSMTPSDFDHEVILLNGTGQAHLEKILDTLEARRHETVLEVNLDALVANYKVFRSCVKPSTGIVAMVKASGYGTGSYEIAKTLQSQGAAYLAVAVADEGVELRHRGISMPIMVLNPKVMNYRTLFNFMLEPEIYSLDILSEIIREGERQGVKGFPVHIKIDSGMHRLGFLEEDLPQLVAMLKAQDVVTPKSVFSHLAAADCPNMDDYTRRQFSYFDRCCATLQSAFPDILRHILNSTGIIRFPEKQYDLVRLGIGLYGIPTMDDPIQRQLCPVSALRTVVISVKEWPAGTTIGYSRRGLLTRHSAIATIPIGYADGLNRHMGNGRASVVIRGQRCPIVGNICMDLCMVDVTGTGCQMGDSVEIFGNEVTAVELAELLGTIPYEILTSVSERVKRVYYRE